MLEGAGPNIRVQRPDSDLGLAPFKWENIQIRALDQRYWVHRKLSVFLVSMSKPAPGTFLAAQFPDAGIRDENAIVLGQVHT